MASNNKITITEPITIIGLMSGTSMDGIDAVIEKISMDNGNPIFMLQASKSYNFEDKTLISELRNVPIGKDITGTELDKRVATEFANAANKIIKSADLTHNDIDLIASHGQTVWYQPKVNYKKAKACIIGDGKIIAKKTGIKTIYDFRTADINAGGLAAPMAPILHFYKFPKSSIVLNIGGIANITAIDEEQDIEKTIAFDTGPGNFLIDELVRFYSKQNESFDKNGKWSAKGKANKKIVDKLMEHPYFSKVPPKATDRSQFDPDLFKSILSLGKKENLTECDLIATAALLTSTSIAKAITDFVIRHPERSEGSLVIPAKAGIQVQRLVVTGGGRHNPTLMKQLTELLPDLDVMTSEQINVDGDVLEAELMAFLGFLTINGFPGNIPHITGASYPVVLGKVVEPGSS